MGKILAAMVLSLGLCSASSAQVIYAPVQSQYQIGNCTFYYGGNNARVFQYAQAKLGELNKQESLYATWTEGRPGGNYLHRGLINEPRQTTFNDAAPYQNAIVYGYTSVDARNDAYANVPCFFRMADLRAQAVPAADGVGVVVPAQAAGTIDIHPTHRVAPATNPATQPKPVMIIPKKLLEKKAGEMMTKAE
jgi:hypothetical protein